MKLDFEQAKKILKESVENADTPLDMYIAFFDKIYEQGYKDGFSVIEDIKEEIHSMFTEYGDGTGVMQMRNQTLNEVLKVINNHISRKENK